MGCLYRLTFPSGKCYVGITACTAGRRFALHCAEAKRSRCKTLVGKALRKYGADAVKVETLAVYDDWNSLCEVERRAIAAFGTKVPAGYNMTDGGDGVVGLEITEEFRRKSGDSRRGLKNSEAHNEALRAANLGRTASEDTRRKLSEITKQRWADGQFAGQSERAKAQWKDPAFRASVIGSKTGVTQSAETRAKRSAAMRDKKFPNRPRQSDEMKAKRLASFMATIAKRRASVEGAS